jgi:hypothetical protein
MLLSGGFSASGAQLLMQGLGFFQQDLLKMLVHVPSAERASSSVKTHSRVPTGWLDSEDGTGSDFTVVATCKSRRSLWKSL